MKPNRLHYWPLLAALFAVSAGAQEVLQPGGETVELNRIKQVGRLMVFSGQIPGASRTWVLPTAFRTSLECSPQGASESRLCTLRIYNAASATEAAEIGAAYPIGDLPGSPLLRLESDLNSPLALAGGAKPIVLDPLQFRSEKNALASIGYRYRPGVDADIPELYQGIGLGRLTLNVSLRARRTHESIALDSVRTPEELKARVGQEGLPLQELMPRLSQWMGQQSWMLSKVNPEEAKVIIPRLIQWRFFESSPDGRYFWKAGIEPSPVVFEAIQQPIELRCKVSLLLKREALPSVSCTEEAP